MGGGEGPIFCPGPLQLRSQYRSRYGPECQCYCWRSWTGECGRSWGHMAFSSPVLNCTSPPSPRESATPLQAHSTGQLLPKLSTCRENLCAGGWAAAKERSGIAYVVTFLLLLPVREFVLFLCAIDTLPTTPGRPVSWFYRPRQELGDCHFSILLLPLRSHWTWAFPGTSAVLATHPVLQEDKLQT